MADFFKSLAGGFGTGLQLSQAMRDREERERAMQMREELQKAYGLTPQEQLAPVATPEQLQRAQAETQALAQQDAIEFGLSPQDMRSYAPAQPVEGQRTAMPTYALGGRTFERPPTDFEIDAARTRAAANVYGKYGDTAQREGLLRALRAEERALKTERRLDDQALLDRERATRDRAAFLTQQREAEYRLDALAETAAERKNLRAFEDRLNTIANPSTDDVTKLSKEFNLSGATKDAVLSRFITGKGLVRGEEAAARMQAFNQWQVQNPNAGFPEIAAETKRLGMSIDEQYNIASKMTGIDRAAFDASEMRIRRLVQGKNLDGLLKAHKESDDLDPGTHFEVIRGKGGTLTLNRVDSKTGTVVQPNVFTGNEAEATAYLNKAATDPSTIVDFTMNLQKTRAAIEASQASTRASDATTGLRGAQITALRNSEANAAERAAIVERFDNLTPEEQSGPKGQALLRQFNLLNVRAGGTVPLGAAPRTERVEPTAAELTTAREMVGKAVMTPDGKKKLDPDGKPVKHTLETALAEVLGATRPNRTSEAPSSGLGSNPYAPAASTSAQTRQQRISAEAGAAVDAVKTQPLPARSDAQAPAAAAPSTERGLTSQRAAPAARPAARPAAPEPAAPSGNTSTARPPWVPKEAKVNPDTNVAQWYVGGGRWAKYDPRIDYTKVRPHGVPEDAKFNPSTNAWEWATFFGGRQQVKVK